MKPIQNRWLLSATAAIILSACSSATPAPVIAGTDGGGGYGYDNGTVSTPYGSVNVPAGAVPAGYGYNNGTVTTPYGSANVPTAANPAAGYGYNNGAVSTPYGSVNVPAGAVPAGYGYNNGTVTTPYGTATVPTTGTVYAPPAAQANPYGVAPNEMVYPQPTQPATGTVYAPPAAQASPYGVGVAPNETVYTQPTQPAYTQPTAARTPAYRTVGNYPPVDINATHHRVVKGDTVYNIAKRYGIGQDQLRAWNNFSGNTIKLGQTLRVKPRG